MACLTPLLAVQANWFVKMDCLLPGHSHKSRAAQYIVQAGIRDGLIIPGQTTLIEKTGGNFGLGLANQDTLGKRYFYTDQFNNVGSLHAHEHMPQALLMQFVAQVTIAT
jgi:hypothetical protein